MFTICYMSAVHTIVTCSHSWVVNFPGMLSFLGSQLFREANFPGKIIFWQVNFHGKSNSREVQCPWKSNFPESLSSREVNFPVKSMCIPGGDFENSAFLKMQKASRVIKPRVAKKSAASAAAAKRPVIGGLIPAAAASAELQIRRK